MKHFFACACFAPKVVEDTNIETKTTPAGVEPTEHRGTSWLQRCRAKLQRPKTDVPALPISIIRKINAALDEDEFATARTARVSSAVSSPQAQTLATARFYTPRDTVRDMPSNDVDDTSIANAVMALLDTPPERPGDVFEFTPLPEAAVDNATPVKDEPTNEDAAVENDTPLTKTPPFVHVPPPPAYPSTMYRRIQWPSLDELPPLDTEDEEEAAPVEALGERLAAAQ